MIHKPLWDRIRDLEAKVTEFDALSNQVKMIAAHVENLIDRVADLEGTPRPKRAWEGSEQTSG